MAKKKRSEYTKQRERIIKVYSRLRKKGYEILEDTYLPTTKELLAEDTNPEEYAKYLKKLKTKDIKKGLKLLDPETGIILNADEIKEYEKEKFSTDNVASFYDWLKDVLENVILPDGLPHMHGRGKWIDITEIQYIFNRFVYTVLAQIDKQQALDSISGETKQDITEQINKLMEVPYYEQFEESLGTLTRLILNRPMTQEESEFISDWSDYANGGATV